MNIIKKLFIITLLCNITNIKSELKQADSVFKRWTEIQRCMNDITQEGMKNNFGELNIIALKSRYSCVLNYLETFACLCDLIQSQYLKNGFFELQAPQEEEIKTKFEYLYSILENNIPEFIQYLKFHNFAGELKDYTNIKISDSTLIEEAKEMINILFYNQDYFKTEEFLFGIANRFYEYCFDKETFKEFETMLKNESDHPIVKFLYSVIWWNLAGSGWKHWHKDCINNLKQKSDSGNEIIYIAGGSDIYQLIKAGIYNIRLIDPILPSQPKYYSQDWDWLVVGGERNADPRKDIESENCGICDEIFFDLDKKIIMKRVSFDETTQNFQAQLATGQTITIPKSITTWNFYQADKEGKIINQKPLGTFTIERRFTEQNDFELQQNKTLLISFNELYFITSPANKGGWGINPFKFDDKLQIYVKQLRAPVSCPVTRNMRKAANQMEFSYIALGTCVD